MDETVVEWLPPEKFEHYWPMVERELKTVPHVWQDYWTLESIRSNTLGGYFQCWAVGGPNAVRLVCWSQIVFYPTGNVLRIFLIIGTEFDQHADTMIATAEKFAFDKNCIAVDVTGRVGWGPKLRKFGFRVGASSFSKKVDNRRLQ